ncbi:Rz1-like lysis system protein LysC [Marinobacter sp. OP 3.4]|uniref:Rz1-like lysis system protein LysC n=1 Tax=Marinobacter sp. OP 3.4 TaxID=3076501 RepID=UPI003FA53E19
MLLSGCSTAPPVVKPQENLLIKCPKTLPPLTDGTARDVVLTMSDWASQYHDCATRQRGLVDAIKEITNANAQ